MKNMTSKYRYFLESKFVRINRSLVLICLENENHLKRLKALLFFKGIIKNYNVVINEKTSMTNPLIPLQSDRKK